MTLYYMEKKEDGTVSLFDVKMKDRAVLWACHPNAKEITKKEYDELIEFLNSDEYKKTQLKYNK